jgi:hypothetical protein
LLPPAATLPPPCFALKQGISEDWWQSGSKFKHFIIQVSEVLALH